MTAAIDGSEEVWSAILASTLTHIAVFVPLLFLTGVSSIMFGQLSVVVIVLAGDVAVRRGDHRAGAVLAAADAAGAGRPSARGLTGRLFTLERALPRRHRRGLRASCCTSRSHHRPTVVRASASLLFVAAIFVLLDAVGFELQPQTDEGEVTVDAELAVGTRIERTEAALVAARGDASARSCPRRGCSSRRPAAAAVQGFGRRQQPRQHHRPPRRRGTSATRSSDADRHGPAPRSSPASRRHRPRPRRRAATAAAAACSAAAPTAAASSLEIRGHDLDDAAAPGAATSRPLMDATPGHRRLAPRPRRGPARAGRARRSRQGGACSA